MINQLGQFNEISSSSSCPLCNTPFPTLEDLNSSITNLSKTISENSSNENNMLIELQQKLLNILIELKLDINELLGENFNINDITEKKKILIELKDNEKEQQRLKQLLLMIKIEPDTKIKSIEDLTKIITIHKKVFSDKDFSINYENKKLELLYDFIKSLVDDNCISMERLEFSVSRVKDKKEYIRNLFIEQSNEKYANLTDELFKKIKTRKQLTTIKDELKKISDVYEDSIKEHKKSITNKIKIPLLIYTGKILQDHQNGLGVFITSDDEFRFVTSGNLDVDILNTFSSGQLSAFVLAFLFVMNTMYSSRFKSLNFLLIDDPVQVMDDINIASFVEIMRNNHNTK